MSNTNNNIKKFKEFESNKNDKNDKNIQDEKSSDIVEITIDDEKVENPEDYYIDQVLDISMGDKERDDESEVKSLSEAGISGTVGMHADLSVRQTKRGDIIYITALLKRNNNMASPGVQGVLKVRVVDIYYGTSYMNKVINQ